MDMTVIWIVVIIFSLIIEAITINLVSIWFVFGALAGILCDRLLHLEMINQVIVFAIISIIIIIITRPLVKKYSHGNITKTNLDQLVGTHCLVTKTIGINNKGEAIVNGNSWLATSIDNEIIEEGQYGEIVSIEGAHLVLRKIKGDF